MITKKDFIESWVAYQKAKKAYEQNRDAVIDQIDVKGEKVGGYYLTVSYRPVFSNVSLDEARKFDAVVKSINTTKLSQALKAGEKVEGVEYSKYINVKMAL